MTDAYAAGKVVGAVCHGPMGIVNAKDGDKPLVAGKKVCAFTDEEEGMVGLTEKVPFLLQQKMVELGADYQGGARGRRTRSVTTSSSRVRTRSPRSNAPSSASRPSTPGTFAGHRSAT